MGRIAYIHNKVSQWLFNTDVSRKLPVQEGLITQIAREKQCSLLLSLGKALTTGSCEQRLDSCLTGLWCKLLQPFLAAECSCHLQGQGGVQQVECLVRRFTWVLFLPSEKKVYWWGHAIYQSKK